MKRVSKSSGSMIVFAVWLFFSFPLFFVFSDYTYTWQVLCSWNVCSTETCHVQEFEPYVEVTEHTEFINGEKLQEIADFLIDSWREDYAQIIIAADCWWEIKYSTEKTITPDDIHTCNWSVPICGDGIVNTDWEECDLWTDENWKSGSWCSTSCKRTLPYCGDWVVEDFEDCDDWNNLIWDGCNQSCTVEKKRACTSVDGQPSDCVPDIEDPYECWWVVYWKVYTLPHDDLLNVRLVFTQLWVVIREYIITDFNEDNEYFFEINYDDTTAENYIPSGDYDIAYYFWSTVLWKSVSWWHSLFITNQCDTGTNTWNSTWGSTWTSTWGSDWWTWWTNWWGDGTTWWTWWSGSNWWGGWTSWSTWSGWWWSNWSWWWWASSNWWSSTSWWWFWYMPSCGNYVVETWLWEECDLWPDRNGKTWEVCSADCKLIPWADTNVWFLQENQHSIPALIRPDTGPDWINPPERGEEDRMHNAPPIHLSPEETEWNYVPEYLWPTWWYRTI